MGCLFSSLNRKTEVDFSDGPVKHRSCTDLICLLFFVINLVVWGSLMVASATENGGNPEKLISGADFRGNTCGMKHASVDLSNYKYQYMALNMEKLYNRLAEMSDAQKASAFTGSPSGTAKLEALVAGAGDLNDPGADMIKAINDWTIPVCVSECPGLGTHLARTTSPTEFYPKNTALQEAYHVAREDDAVDKSLYENPALDIAVCPYDPIFCVPGVWYSTTTLDRYCIPTLSDPSTTPAPGATTESAALTGSDVLDDLLTDFAGRMIGDLETAKNTFVVVVFGSFILSFLILWMLQYFVGVIVWTSVLILPLGCLAAYLGTTCYSATCAGNGVFEECFGGPGPSPFGILGGDMHPSEFGCLSFKVGNGTNRLLLQYFGLMSGILGVTLAVIFLCMFSRIKLAIAINKVAAEYVSDNKMTVTVPLVQGLLGIGAFFIWLFATIYLVTADDPTSSPLDQGYTSPDPGHHRYYKAYTDVDVNLTGGGGTYVQRTWNTTAETEANGYCQKSAYLDGDLWLCKKETYAIQPMFWYYLFSYFWTAGFMTAIGQISIAGAVGVWYFTENKKGGTKYNPLWSSIYRAFRFHLGTAAFGAFILALISTVKWFCVYTARMLKAQKNKIGAAIASCMACLVACIEKCIAFLSKHAYVQVALTGKGFCTSAKNAFMLLLRNAGRVAVLGSTGVLVHLVLKLVMVGCTVVGGYYLLIFWHEDDIYSVVGPLILYFLIGYAVANLVCTVFGMAVDTTLQCFILDEENHKPGTPYTTPKRLHHIIKKREGKVEVEKKVEKGPYDEKD